MKHFKKKNFPISDVRRFLEPGPIVLVSSHHKGERDIMAMGWHLVMELKPSLIGCYICDQNHSYDLIRKSKECVINIPTVDLIDTIVDVGNCSGTEVDKFETFGLTPEQGKKVEAPLIRECFANFECRLHDGSQIKKHGLFIWEVVNARVAVTPRFPKTVHYRGDGLFMISGREISRRARFKPEKL